MADDGVAIALSDLRDALERLLAAAAEQFGTSIDLAADYYWSIDTREAFDLSREPSWEVGQLSDDVATVRQLLNRDQDEDGLFLWHDLDHAIAILQRIAGLARPLARRRP
jgi:hypothetical protein